MKIFENVDVNYLNITIIYISDKKEIEKISNHRHDLSENNLLTKEELLYLIKKNIILDKTRYKLNALLLYNLTVNLHDLDEYINNLDDSKYLINHKSINDISLNKTLNILDDLNTLYIIFNKKNPCEKLSHTKKIFITDKRKKTYKR